MSRVVVIGATGHIGSYLVPRLVGGGHEVIAMSRGTRGPYHASPQWDSVTRVTVDREAEDAEGTFGARVAALRPDVVIDLICFTAASAQQLMTRCARPVRCSSTAGRSGCTVPRLRVPVTEDEPRTAYGEYGTGKAEIEALLHRETLAGGVPAIVLHPGHISGPGWPVITPAGNLDPAVWTNLATGRPLALPDHGLGVLHHVHADDVAQAFERALSRPAAIGASFHVAAEQAMTLRGLAAGVAQWFGREPVLDFVDWAEFDRRVAPEHAEATRQHTFRSITASIARAKETLGYAPRYSSLSALHEALAWLVANGQVDIGGQQLLAPSLVPGACAITFAHHTSLPRLAPLGGRGPSTPCLARSTCGVSGITPPVQGHSNWRSAPASRCCFSRLVGEPKARAGIRRANVGRCRSAQGCPILLALRRLDGAHIILVEGAAGCEVLDRAACGATVTVPGAMRIP